MKQKRQFVWQGLLGLYLLVCGVYFLMTEDGGITEGLKDIGTALLGLVCMYIALRRYQKVEKPFAVAESMSCERMPANLPFSMLSARFRELATRDALVNADEPGVFADEPERFLGWKSDGDGDFQLFRDEADGGEAWFALWWGRSILIAPDARGHTCLRKVHNPFYVGDEELSALCRQYSIPVQDGFMDMKPHGIALYRGGELLVHPASALPGFRDCFMETVLAPEPDFRDWAEAYYEEEEEENT